MENRSEDSSHSGIMDKLFHVLQTDFRDIFANDKNKKSVTAKVKFCENERPTEHKAVNTSDSEMSADDDRPGGSNQTHISNPCKLKYNYGKPLNIYDGSGESDCVPDSDDEDGTNKPRKPGAPRKSYQLYRKVTECPKAIVVKARTNHNIYEEIQNILKNDHKASAPATKATRCLNSPAGRQTRKRKSKRRRKIFYPNLKAKRRLAAKKKRFAKIQDIQDVHEPGPCKCGDIRDEVKVTTEDTNLANTKKNTDEAGSSKNVDQGDKGELTPRRKRLINRKENADEAGPSGCGKQGDKGELRPRRKRLANRKESADEEGPSGCGNVGDKSGMTLRRKRLVNWKENADEEGPSGCGNVGDKSGMTLRRKRLVNMKESSDEAGPSGCGNQGDKTRPTRRRKRLVNRKENADKEGPGGCGNQGEKRRPTLRMKRLVNWKENTDEEGPSGCGNQGDKRELTPKRKKQVNWKENADEAGTSKNVNQGDESQLTPRRKRLVNWKENADEEGPCGCGNQGDKPELTPRRKKQVNWKDNADEAGTSKNVNQGDESELTPRKKRLANRKENADEEGPSGCGNQGDETRLSAKKKRLENTNEDTVEAEASRRADKSDKVMALNTNNEKRNNCLQGEQGMNAGANGNERERNAAKPGTSGLQNRNNVGNNAECRNLVRNRNKIIKRRRRGRPRRRKGSVSSRRFIPSTVPPPSSPPMPQAPPSPAAIPQTPKLPPMSSASCEEISPVPESPVFQSKERKESPVKDLPIVEKKPGTSSPLKVFGWLQSTAETCLKTLRNSLNDRNMEQNRVLMERAKSIWLAVNMGSINHTRESYVPWHCLKSWQKLPFFWAAMSNELLSESPKENFERFFNAHMVDNTRNKSRNRYECSRVWQRLSSHQKYPFIVEALIAQVCAGKVNLNQENEIYNSINRLLRK